MSVSSQNNVIRMTADNDTYGNAEMGKLKIKGVRLVAGGAAASAQLRVANSSGHILMSLKCAQDTDTESQIPFYVDGGVIHLDLSGANAEVFVYVE